ncbi:MAG: DUF1592 domain-containing protein [Planctomycetota bacterium]
MRRRAVALGLWLASMSGIAWAQTDPFEISEPLKKALEESCFTCHRGSDASGGLDLVLFPGNGDAEEQLELFGQLSKRVRAVEMPPPDLMVLTDEERESLVALLDQHALKLAEQRKVEPPPVTVRRLSRAEYRNTVRDLFGIECRAVERFPVDDLGYGFDNIGDALSTSLLHLEKYVAAADEIGRLVVPDEAASEPSNKHLEAELLFCSIETSEVDGAVNLFTRGYVRTDVYLARSGPYELRIHAGADQAGDELASMVVTVDGKLVATIPVDASRSERKTYSISTALEGGEHRIQLAFTNDYYEPENPDPKTRDRNLHLDWLEIVGPLNSSGQVPGEEWIFALDPGEKRKTMSRAEPIIEQLLRRVWRRPPSRDEEKRFQRLVLDTEKEGGTFRQGIRNALEAALVSPNFLFRIEVDSRSGEISPYELASRLSYFLWSSTPDLRLLDLAESGELEKKDVLLAETKRLLADERASALATNFAAQWLEIRNLSVVQPDPDRFGGFDDDLRHSLRRETEMLFEYVLRQGRPARELITANYTFLDERLARHYGIAGVSGNELQRIELKDPRRGGLLSQGSILTVTSNPTRTSIVKRGKWVLTNILDATPPAPPPGNDSLPDEEEALVSASTLREQMALHRSKPECASCHVRMDALGFALENYDAVGQWREADDGGEIDTSGELPSGQKLEGVADLKQYLATSPDFLVTLAKKLFVYSVGRDVSVIDDIVIRRLVSELPAEATIQDLIERLVQLRAFRSHS